MKIWAIIRTNGKITQDTVLETKLLRPLSAEDISVILKDVCYELDLSCPLVLNKHVRDMENFARTVFLPDDFMEPVKFDKFEIELLPEKKTRAY